MRRRFNVVGPNHSDLHYTLPSDERLADVPERVARGEYVVVYAPRLYGRTTWLRGLGAGLVEAGAWAVVRASCRPTQAGGDAASSDKGLLEALMRAAEEALPLELRPPPVPPTYDVRFIGPVLSAWARTSPKPIVLLLDDADLAPKGMIQRVLAEFGATFAARPRAAPWSIVLMGSDETRAQAAERCEIAITRRLEAFTEADVARLFAEHTRETGQAVREEAIARIAAITGGHPWAVNVIGRDIVERQRPPSQAPITVEHVQRAARRLHAAWV